MRNRDYIPRKIAKFEAFVNNLAQVLFLHKPAMPREWGYSLLDYDTLISQIGMFNAIYSVANPAGNKGSRSSAQTLTLKQERRACETAVRKFVKRWLLFNPSVTNPDKTDLNLKIRKARAKQIAPIKTSPHVLRIDINQKMMHTLFFRDTQSVKRAFPKGVMHCMIKYAVRESNNPPNGIDECNFVVTTGKSAAVIKFSAKDRGKTAFYFLCWINSRGELGVCSQMSSAPVV